MTNLCTPWSLQFHRDGTEDYAVILDADGDELVTSRHFWLPEGNDPVPPTLAAIRVMFAAPRLLEALKAILDTLPSGNQPWEINAQETVARDLARAAIAETEGNG